MSGLASAAVKPGSHRPATIGAGAVNQRSPVPLTRMPQSVPLRAMVVTSVHPGMFSAGASIAFIAGIERFR